MKSLSSTTSLNSPVDILCARLGAVRNLAGTLVRQLSSEAESERKLALERELREHLGTGLEFYLGQLDYFLASDAATIAEEWLLLIDALELQASWLEQRADSVHLLDGLLAAGLKELALACADLVGAVVAVRLWQNRLSDPALTADFAPQGSGPGSSPSRAAQRDAA